MFLGAAGRLASGAVMGVQVGGAVLNGVIHGDVPFQPLMQIPGLRNVDRNPTAILRLPRIDKIAGQRLEGGIQGEHLVEILLPG